MLDISTETGKRLSSNSDFKDWIIDQAGVDRMPDNIERYWRSLNRGNMDQRLFAIYRWTKNQENFSRLDFLYWLEDLNNWYDRFSGGDAVMAYSRNSNSSSESNRDEI